MKTYMIEYRRIELEGVVVYSFWYFWELELF